MTRHRFLAATLALGVTLLGPARLAAAKDGSDDVTTAPSPTSPATPGGTGTAYPSGVEPPASAAQATSSPTSSLTSSPTGSPSSTAASNQAPVASDDHGSVVAGRTLTLAVLGNDTDDGLPADSRLTITRVDPSGGRVGFTATRVTFTARPADRGTFTFGYDASDGELSDTATVTVTVTRPARPVPRTVGIAMPATVVALHKASVTGQVHPVRPGPVTVRLQRRTPSGWTLAGSDRADSTGGYEVRFRTDLPRRYAFRAVATWPDGKTATSATLTRRVVARPEVSVSGPLHRAGVRWSYRAGCPVKPGGLRRITLNRFTYRHRVARGSLVVSAGSVPDLVRVFTTAFDARFPLRSMRPVDAFYAGGRRTPTQSDLAAMRADNTSAFNCRPVTGNPYRVSQHSYGNAIDINTVRNPYVVGSRVYPSFARTYLDRSRYRTGMIMRGGAVASTMRRLGWPWGARWSHPDYQHFSSNGG